MGELRTAGGKEVALLTEKIGVNSIEMEAWNCGIHLPDNRAPLAKGLRPQGRDRVYVQSEARDPSSSRQHTDF